MDGRVEENNQVNKVNKNRALEIRKRQKRLMKENTKKLGREKKNRGKDTKGVHIKT